MRTIIIDTDPGIDDAAALAIALFDETLDIKLITTVAGNVSLDKVTYNALRLMKFWNKSIPIAQGASEPLIQTFEDASDIHGISGMEGFDFTDTSNELLCSDCAIYAMKKVIDASPYPVTLAALGPLTNIALLLKVFPKVKNNIEQIVFMGGSLNRGNKTVMAEFNIATDPEAAKIVFSSTVPLVMLPLDIGKKAYITAENSEILKNLNKTGTMLYHVFQQYRGGSIAKGLSMYDSTVFAYILQPELFETNEVYIDVELAGSLTGGCTVVDLAGFLKKNANAKVCINVNATAFNQWFLRSLKKCI